MNSRIIMVGALLLVLTLSLAAGVAANGGSFERTYTLDADFDEGTLVNVNHDAPNNDQLQLDNVATPFDFIWVAASGLDTIVKIDTNTGAVLGEYLSRPDGRGGDPSRTTVDNNGNVWVGNRNEWAGNKGSAVHIGLVENGQCVDRNGNGVIDTSTGLGDVRLWLNPGGVDDNGGVSSAEDECIIHYVRTAATAVRTIAVDANNDVWIGGIGNMAHQLHDGATGAPIGSVYNINCGGYGGLIDSSGVLWSARIGGLLRYVPGSPDPGLGAGVCLPISNGYGLGVDSFGNVWNSQWTNDTVTKFSPAGAPLGTFGTGGFCARGVVATADNNMWIANSCTDNVGRLNNAGGFVTSVGVGTHPTGVAVDSSGKVWVTNLVSDDVMRIDPSTNVVDLTVGLRPGSIPYNYSDMTGSTLIAPPDQGAWTVVADSGIAGAQWQLVSWTADEPGDSSITVKVASSTDGVTFGPEVVVTNGGTPTVAAGQYLKVIVTFLRSTTTDADGDGIFDSPILYDLTISTNRPPDCSEAAPSIDTLWPPNHAFHPVDILGVSDPDGHMVSITIDGIRQDEPVDTYGDGRFTPDAVGVGTTTAEVRAERSGTKKVPGDGRVYLIDFTADDGYGLTCSGTVQVGVPHDVKDTPVDSGPPYYDSTALAP